MNAPLPLPCLNQLDEVQHLHELERFDATRFLDALERELGDGDETLQRLAAQLDGLHQALQRIEQFTVKAMAIRLTHLLSREPVPPQLRTLLSTTVANYADDLKLLRQRFGRSVSAPSLEAIVQAAAQVLDTRQRLRIGALTLGQRIAAAQGAWLDKAARDRSLPDAERLRLRLARLDLRELIARPERLEANRFEARMKTLPPPEEEIEVEPPEAEKVSRFALLELD
jgi:hypothetical protein